MCASKRTKRKKSVKKQAQASCEQWPGEGFFHSLIQYAPNVILFLSQDHRIIEFNPEAERLYGCRRSDVLGKDYFELFLPVEVREAVAADIEKVLKGEISRGFENVVIAHNGQEHVLSWNVARVLDSDEKPIGILAIGLDITDLKQSDSALIQERDKLQALMDGITRAGIGIDIVGDDYRILFQNETLEQRFGDIRGEPCYKHYMSQESPCDRCTVLEAIQQNSAVELEHKGLDGRDYQIFSAPLPETDGSVNKAIEIVMDITERKQAEEAMKKSSIIINSTTDAVICTDTVGNITFWNKGAEIIYGYRKEEVIGKSISIIYKDQDLHVLESMIADLMEGKDIPGLEVTCIDKNKQDVEVLLSLTTIKDKDGNITEFVGITKDITEHKQAQRALVESEERYRTLYENAGDAIFIMEGDKFIDCNQKTLEMFACQKEQIIGETPYRFSPSIQPDGMDSVTKACAKIKAALEGTPQHFEWKHQRLDGTLFDVGVSLNAVELSTGPCIQAIVRDITERKQAEEAQKESEERFRKLSEAAFEGIAFSEGGMLVDANKAFVEIYDSSLEELKGKQVIELVAPEHRELVTKKIRSGYEGTYEHRGLRKDGSLIDLEIQGRNVTYRGRNVRLTAIRDITERKKAERRIQEYQGQLKSLASELALAEERERRRIAAGLHDDIAQKLAMAKLGLQTLHASLADTDLSQSLEKQCHIMEQIVEDARSLTFELSNPLLYQVGLDAAVESHLSKQIQDELGIECKFRIEGPHSSLDDNIKVVLFQAVRELIANVVKHANASTLEVCITNSEEELKIVVEDDGIGFDPARIGPHGVEKGGFGLFNIRERLEYLGGNLEIESGREKGACVIMSVPIKTDAVV